MEQTKVGEMSRRSLGPRLYLRIRKGKGYWVIRDGQKEQSTACAEGDRSTAEKALEEYMGGRSSTTRLKVPSRVRIAEVIKAYLDARELSATKKKNSAWSDERLGVISEWFGDKWVDEISKEECEKYTTKRLEAVAPQTVRHELGQLRAAVNHYRRNYGLGTYVDFWLPPKPPPLPPTPLTRQQLAARIRAARKLPRCRHVVRCIILGYYTGMGPAALQRLQWECNQSGGWIDLDNFVIHRRLETQAENNQYRPTCSIHPRLLPFLRRWRKADQVAGCPWVISYCGKPIEKLRRSWRSVTQAAGLGMRNVMRHTAATWQMQSGANPYDVADYLGMSMRALMETYGHHHPDYQRAAATSRLRPR